MSERGRESARACVCVRTGPTSLACGLVPSAAVWIVAVWNEARRLLLTPPRCLNAPETTLNTALATRTDGGGLASTANSR